MMKRLLIAGFITFLACSVCAQVDLPSSCSIGRPKLLDANMLKENDVLALYNSHCWGQDRKTTHYWVAYSDRSHNTTYVSPSVDADEYDELILNEEVRIAKIEGDYALVYSGEKVHVVYPRISSEAKSRGWIPMRNLLLWNSCPTDDKGILQKAWIGLNLDSLSSPSDEDVGMLFLNPDTKDCPQKMFPDMKFYFVMKHAENGLILLSKSSCLFGQKSQQLYGWVHKNSLMPCNQRLFLEPNWIAEEAEQLKGKKAYVYNHYGEIVAAIAMGRQNNITEGLATKYRLEPERMRFPVIENISGDNNRYKIIALVSSGMPDVPTCIDYEAFRRKDLMAFYGSVDKKDSITGLDYWKPVILISQEELSEFINKLQSVMAAAIVSVENRKPYVEAMKELIRILYGDIGENEMMTMDTRNVMALVEGLVVKPNSLNGRALRDIMDPKVVSQEAFAMILSEFKNKYEKLNKIRASKYNFTFTISDGTRWYWIPLQDLP